MRIENYCSGLPQMDAEGYPVTHKADKSNHGFGVRSMRQTVEKYGGQLTYEVKDDLYVVKALFVVGA